MKTTLNINDQLYRKAKAQAALEGRQLTELVQEGLQYVVEKKRGAVSRDRRRVTLPLIPRREAKATLFAGMSSEEIHEKLFRLDSEG